MLFSSGIGIDLGTSSVLVYVTGKGIILREPSCVAVRTEGANTQNEDAIVAIGEKAYQMVGRTPKNLKTVFPLESGVISDYFYTEQMLRYFVQKTSGRQLIKPVVAVCIPCKITQVEQRAIIDALTGIGARSVHLIEEPVAAALGAGFDIQKPSGLMVVDIGGGTADIAVISLGGVVVGASVKAAGNTFDEDIIRMVKYRHGLLIGKRTAEMIKIQIGTADPEEEERFIKVKGRCIANGLPTMLNISSKEVCDAISESVNTLTDSIREVLEKTPPELAADITEHGIMMTGASSLLSGLDRVIARRTGIECFVADDPSSCVAIGTGKYIESLV